MEHNIKQIIKSYLTNEGKTLVDVVNIINENRTNENRTTKQNLNNKLTRGTIKYSEVLEIAEALGYNIVWEKGYSSKTSFDNKTNSNSFDTVKKSYNMPINNPYSATDTNTTGNGNMILHLESSISKFVDIVFNMLSNVDIPETLCKNAFENLAINRDTLSNKNIFIDYFSTLYNVLLMTNKANEFLPILYYLRNMYSHGGLQNLQEDSKIFLSEMLNHFNTKYDCYVVTK